MKMDQKITILDIPFNKLTFDEAVQAVLSHIHSPQHLQSKPFFIATPNPEMLLEARKNAEFRSILQNTGLNIPDGVGIIWASKRLKSPLPQRITGVDLMQKICASVSKNTPVFLLGAAEGVAEKVKEKLTLKNPDLNIAETYAGSPAEKENEKIVNLINQSQAKILFVAFGAPNQELWIAKNLNKFKYLKIAMGVGGAFNFIAERRKRAPKWMQKLALEWLYRLIQEPKRIKRIFNATIKFPIVFLLNQRQKKHR